MKERNLSGIWSMIFGILALLNAGLNPFFSIPAIVLCFVSVKCHGHMTKSGLAGLICGGIAFMLGLLIGMLILITGGVFFFQII